jgi:hypothetical protein
LLHDCACLFAAPFVQFGDIGGQIGAYQIGVVKL